MIKHQLIIITGWLLVTNYHELSLTTYLLSINQPLSLAVGHELWLTIYNHGISWLYLFGLLLVIHQLFLDDLWLYHGWTRPNDRLIYVARCGFGLHGHIANVAEPSLGASECSSRNPLLIMFNSCLIFMFMYGLLMVYYELIKGLYLLMIDSGNQYWQILPRCTRFSSKSIHFWAARGRVLG